MINNKLCPYNGNKENKITTLWSVYHQYNTLVQLLEHGIFLTDEKYPMWLFIIDYIRAVNVS